MLKVSKIAALNHLAWLFEIYLFRLGVHLFLQDNVSNKKECETWTGAKQKAKVILESFENPFKMVSQFFSVLSIFRQM